MKIIMTSTNNQCFAIPLMFNNNSKIIQKRVLSFPRKLFTQLEKNIYKNV